MGIVGYKIPDGIIHMAEIDAKFKHEGKTVLMVYHRYCGPEFFYADKEETPLYPGDEEEYMDLWRQFEGWAKAKKNKKYPSIWSEK
jgi:hypothetical protein